MSVKKLREAFASAFDSLDPDDDVLEECPPSDVIYNAAQGLLPAETLATVTDHMASCPVCAEAYRLARGTPAPPSERTREPG